MCLCVMICLCICIYTTLLFPAIYIYIYRVKRARSELEALTKLQGMEDFVEGLTPEWLKSLIIDGKYDVDKTIVHLIGNEPDRCLKLLQVYILYTITFCKKASFLDETNGERRSRKETSLRSAVKEGVD